MKTKQILYIWYICIKRGLALNNLQWLICRKTQLTKKHIFNIYEQDLVLNNLQWLTCYKTTCCIFICRCFFLIWFGNLLYSHNHEQLYIHICMQKHIQHNKDERRQFLRKIYLSLYSKGFFVRGELETEENCSILNPNSSDYSSISFQFSWAAHPGSWGPSPCWDMVSFQHLLSNWSEPSVAGVI